MQVISVKCKSCGASINVDDDSKKVVCEYCGTHLYLLRKEAPQQPVHTQSSYAEPQKNFFTEFYTSVAKHGKKIGLIITAISIAVVLSVMIPLISVYGSLFEDLGGIFGQSQDKTGGSDSSNHNQNKDGADSGGDFDFKETISFTIELENGHFTAGIDFPAGIYNLTAIARGGNVYSKNAINAIMGVESKGAHYLPSYQNVKLPENAVLSIDKVKIRLSSGAASGESLRTRSEIFGEAVEFGAGNYTAGVDFWPGLYNIVAVNGGGNISSNTTSLSGGGFNAIMGTAQHSSNEMYQPKYYHIDFSSTNTTLKISGTLRVSLIPVR